MSHVPSTPFLAGTGSGLGLAIVQELANAHGAVAHAENIAPRGARVGVTLRRVPWPAPGWGTPLIEGSISG